MILELDARPGIFTLQLRTPELEAPDPTQPHISTAVAKSGQASSSLSEGLEALPSSHCWSAPSRDGICHPGR